MPQTAWQNRQKDLCVAIIRSPPVIVHEVASRTPFRAARWPCSTCYGFRLTLPPVARYPVGMADSLSRRMLLRQAGIVAALTAVARPSEARRGEPQIYGVGRI